MISAADLQKLISTGAVKSVTRTNSGGSSSSSGGQIQISRQAVVKEGPSAMVQQAPGQVCKFGTACIPGVGFLIKQYC